MGRVSGRASTRRIPWQGVAGPGARFRVRILWGGGLSVGAWLLLQWVSPPPSIPWTPVMETAAETMTRGLASASAHCRLRGIPMDPVLDPHQTCLVGPQLTPLFTTLGQLEAKRTTLNPDLAGLLVHLMAEAGVEPGDSVAVGASGSFPGLLLATLAAAEAMGAETTTILSLGSSSYGATRPDFHLLDLHELLRGEGIIAGVVAAVSLGGESDAGLEMDPGIRESLRAGVSRAGVPFLEQAELASNVERRMAIYGEPVVFVNIGGAEANLGTSPSVLEVPPGLVTPGSVPFPPAEERGVLFEMLAREVPAIHLLHLRGLAFRYGLPWDPPVLSPPGATRLVDSAAGKGWGFWLLTTAYAISLLVLFRPFVRHRPIPGGG